MDKLVEREVITRNPLTAAPALAVQFFLIPLAVVAMTTIVYLGFRMMVTDDRSAQDYLAEIQNGGSNRRWPAAYELSRLMASPAIRAKDKTLAPALIRAFEDSKDDDPRVRRYLALALGRLDPPLPARATTLLLDALNDADSETRINAIWALGSGGDPAVVPALEQMFASTDSGIRKMTVYALGALPGDAPVRTLQVALNDPVPDVQWNAAVALARHGHRDGIPVLRRMLDREYVTEMVKIPVRADDDFDPVADVMISGLRAAAVLKDPSLRESVATLSRSDRSMRVRQAAIEALKAMNGRV